MDPGHPRPGVGREGQIYWTGSQESGSDGQIQRVSVPMSEGVRSNSGKWGDGTPVDSSLTPPAPGGDYPGGEIWVAVGRVEGRVWQITWSDTWSGYLVLFLFKGVAQTELVKMIYDKVAPNFPHRY